jgi:hypothetical protein
MRRATRSQIAVLLMRMLDKALAIQTPVVRDHVARMQRQDSARSPQQLVESIERQYMATVAAMGCATGAAAAVPGAGAAVALPLNLAEIGGFVEATALYVLALAEIYEIDLANLQRRQTLILAVLIGEPASKIIAKAAGRTGPYWARLIVNGTPMSTITLINKALGRNFVTKYGTKQGILVLARELPFGIGAVIGGAGNLALAYLSVRAARKAFGPPPVCVAASQEASREEGFQRPVGQG